MRPEETREGISDMKRAILFRSGLMVGCREYRSPSGKGPNKYIDPINRRHDIFDLNNTADADRPLSSGCSA